MKINDIVKTETYIEMTGDNGWKMLSPTNATIFVEDSDSTTVKTTGSRKSIGYKTNS